ncbi:hypothetical protein SLE2022_393280 [Rubroshorea leprosula]
MSVKSRIEYGSRSLLSRKEVLLLCFASFCAGMFFTYSIVPETKSLPRTSRTNEDGRSNLKSGKCNPKLNKAENSSGEISSAQKAIQTLGRTISDIEMELMAARAERETVIKDSLAMGDSNAVESNSKRKYFMVVGINTAFGSRKRRDSVRETWMPQGDKQKQLEEEKGIIMRFVIGHSSTPGGILDRAIDAEEKVYGDFMRLPQHIEGYLELSAKTKAYFATAVSLWDAEFYVKVDDDVHVNPATLARTLAGHRKKARVYIGCMKSGPVLAQKGVKYHEPEHWKFGEVGNKYFRHATGQLYAISKDLATYISINQNVLHKYANEDVSLGSWFIGLDVEHVDDRRLCCGTPPDCEWKAQAGYICAASFDWRCSGICRSAERMMEVHKTCGEDKNALWSGNFLEKTSSSS